jgi:hypothetical protein
VLKNPAKTSEGDALQQMRKFKKVTMPEEAKSAELIRPEAALRKEVAAVRFKGNGGTTDIKAKDIRLLVGRELLVKDLIEEEMELEKSLMRGATENW